MQKVTQGASTFEMRGTESFAAGGLTISCMHVANVQEMNDGVFRSCCCRGYKAEFVDGQLRNEAHLSTSPPRLHVATRAAEPLPRDSPSLRPASSSCPRLQLHQSAFCERIISPCHPCARFVQGAFCQRNDMFGLVGAQ